MEKSSEKLIHGEKVANNPFNNLLSEVQIRLNQPKSTKKIEKVENYALQIDSNIDRSNSNLNYFGHQTDSKKENTSESSKRTHHNVFVINAPLKTKNSSETQSNQKIQKEIINQWIIGYMGKRHLLGIHWEQNLAAKGKELMEIAFNKIKLFREEPHKQGGNVIRLVKLCEYLEKIRKRQSFIVLKEFYRDDLLFGLSNTIGQEKNNSLMLRIDSDYESLSVQSKKFKQEIKYSWEGSISSQSYKNLTKKGSESGSISEDLSALILNHNKLKFSEELNRSSPQIPRAKNSQKLINTNKQIAELELETKKRIDTQRKLSEDNKNYELPLESNKHLIQTKKQLPLENDYINQSQRTEEDKQPITMTFILKNLHLTSLLQNDKQNVQKELQQHKKEQSKKEIEEHKVPSENKSKQPSKKEIQTDQNNMNRLPFTQSFYQNINPMNGPPTITFIKPEHQKRSTSLQVKPLIPMIIERPELNTNNISKQRLSNNEYYPQQNNRENQRFVKDNIRIITTEKVRPKSATPKITFTFSSSIPSLNSLNVPFNMTQQHQKINDKIQVQPRYHPHYDKQDCILQSILHPQQPINVIKQTPQLERHKNNKLQVLSPSSRRPESPKRAKNAPTKIALDNRQHIKNLILPSFNDYYGPQKNQKQGSNVKIMLNDHEVIYTDKLQKSTAQNSIFGCSPRQSNLNCLSKDQQRVKSPKDKIFVTYSSRNHL